MENLDNEGKCYCEYNGCKKEAKLDYKRTRSEAKGWPDPNMPISLCEEHAKDRKPIIAKYSLDFNIGKLIIKIENTDIPEAIDYKNFERVYRTKAKKCKKLKYFYKGEWLTVRELAAKYNVNNYTLRMRINRGYPVNIAIGKPIMKTVGRKVFQYKNGVKIAEYSSISEASRIMKCVPGTINNALNIPNRCGRALGYTWKITG